MKCKKNTDVIIAPYVRDFNKWCIYRSDGTEIVISIIQKKIVYTSRPITENEENYIKNNII